eukprot:gene694-772_t
MKKSNVEQSTIRSFIRRFREEAPLSEEERIKPKREDFWWLDQNQKMALKSSQRSNLDSVPNEAVPKKGLKAEEIKDVDAKQEENDVTAAQKEEIRATSDGGTVEPPSTPPPIQLSSSPLEPSKPLLLADDHVHNRADLDHTSANESDSSIRFDFVLSPDSSVSVNSSYAYPAPANEADASTCLPSGPPTDPASLEPHVEPFTGEKDRTGRGEATLEEPRVQTTLSSAYDQPTVASTAPAPSPFYASSDSDSEAEAIHSSDAEEGVHHPHTVAHESTLTAGTSVLEEGSRSAAQNLTQSASVLPPVTVEVVSDVSGDVNGVSVTDSDLKPLSVGTDRDYLNNGNGNIAPLDVGAVRADDCTPVGSSSASALMRPVPTDSVTVTREEGNVTVIPVDLQPLEPHVHLLHPVHPPTPTPTSGGEEVSHHVATPAPLTLDDVGPYLDDVVVSALWAQLVATREELKKRTGT